MPVPVKKFKLSDPSDLISLIPSLVGFEPTNSLVVVCLRERRLVMTMRVDLDLTMDPAAYASEVLTHVSKAHPDEVILVVYSDALADDQRGIKALCRSITYAFELDSGNPNQILDVYQVSNGRYWDLHCTDPACCPAEGKPLEPERVKEVSALLRTPASTRQGLTADAAVDEPTAAQVDWQRAHLSEAARAGAVEGFLEQWNGLLNESLVVGPINHGRLALLQEALLQRAKKVRDTMIASAITSYLRHGINDALDQMIDSTERPDHERATRVIGCIAMLARATKEPAVRIHLLTALAFISWWNGDGARANDFQREASALDQDDGLATLMTSVLERAIVPAWVGASTPSSKSTTE